MTGRHLPQLCEVREPPQGLEGSSLRAFGSPVTGRHLPQLCEAPVRVYLNHPSYIPHSGFSEQHQKQEKIRRPRGILQDKGCVFLNQTRTVSKVPLLQT